MIKINFPKLVSITVTCENTFVLSQKLVKELHIITMFQFRNSTPTTTGMNEHFLIVVSRIILDFRPTWMDSL